MPGVAQNETVKGALLMLLTGEAGAAVSKPFIHTREQDKPPQGKALVHLQKPSLEGRMGFWWLTVKDKAQPHHSGAHSPVWNQLWVQRSNPPRMPKHRETDHRLS